MGPTATSVRRTIGGSQGWRTFEGRMPKLKKTVLYVHEYSHPHTSNCELILTYSFNQIIYQKV